LDFSKGTKQFKASRIKLSDMNPQMLNGTSIIAIAIIIGGLLFIAGGIILFNGISGYSDSVKEKLQVNKTTGLQSMLAKRANEFLVPVINTISQFVRAIVTSTASFLSLIGVGLCALGFCLFKRKYFAWVLTLILMLIAIVIDVVAIGFVSGIFSNEPNTEGIMSADFAYSLIAVLAIHLVVNALIIYYLTKRSTILPFKAENQLKV